MTVETATYLNSLSSSNPGTTDQIPEGDDHLRLIKAVLKSTFPGRGGEEHRAITKAAGYTPALTEVGATFVHTATLVVTLAALAGLPDGTFYNFTAQTGTTTLTPNGADTINGTTTFVLTVGQSCEIVKQGTNWVVLYIPYTAPAVVVQIPIGAIIDFAGIAAPTNYLACPLSASLSLNKVTYAALYAALGGASSPWGSADAFATTFYCPWFPANYSAVQANTNVGTSTTGQILDHTHLSFNLSAGTGAPGGAFGTPGQSGAVVGAAAGAANLAAGMRVMKCIRYQ
jgi:hypothetical protein